MSGGRTGVGAVVAASTWPVAMAADLALRDPAMVRSGAGALQAALAGALLAWPITAAAVCAAVVQVHRRATRELVLALPDRARLRVLVREAGQVTAWSLAGLAASVLVAGLVAALHGSLAQPAAYLALAPVVVGTVAAAALGAAAGLVVPTWVAPPGVGLALYLTYVVVPGDGGGILRFAATEGRLAVTLAPRAVSVVALVLALGCLGGGLSALAAGRAVRRARPTIVGAGLTVVGLVALGPVSALPAYAAVPAGGWACRDLGADQVCLPREQARDLDLLATELAPLAQRVRSVWTAPEPVTYGPAGGPGMVLPVPVPFGTSEAVRPDAAQMISSFVVDCAEPGTPADEAVERYYAFLGWLVPDVTVVSPGEEPVLPFDDAAALDLLRAARTCGV